MPAEAVHLAWRLPARGTREFDALDLASTVLGHGQTSRLHKQLVRGAEIAEGASASTMGLIGGNSVRFRLRASPRRGERRAGSRKR